MTRLALLLGCLFALNAAAQADGGTPGVINIAVLKLKGTAQTDSQTEPVTALIAARLAEEKGLRVITEQDIAALIGLERQKQLLGAECQEGSACFTELAGAIGSEYLVAGRLDRFGEQWTLTTTLFDAMKNEPLARTRTDATSDGELPAAADKAAVAVLQKLQERTRIALAAPKAADTSSDTGPDIGLRIGTNFIEGVTSLSPSGDLVLGYRFDPAWVGFLQIGVTVVRSNEGGTNSGINVLPTVLGARHLYRIDKSFQPYWGLGLGVQLAIGPFGIFERTGPLPSVLGILGFTYFVTRWFGIGLEGSTNLAQTVLGVSRGEGDGFNLKPSLSFTFRP